MDNDAQYLSRIVDATELLIENIPQLDGSKSKLDRADFFLKLAIAYFIQNEKPKAQNHIVEAINIISEDPDDEIFVALINIWQQIIFDGISFEDRLSKMSGSQKRIFEIVLWYSSLIYNEIPREYVEALSCVVQGSLIFCSKKMQNNLTENHQITITYDEEKALYYFTVDGKRLYYAGDDTDNIINNYCFVNQVEQVAHSPHLYFTDDFDIKEGDVFCDIGAGEANIALKVVDKCSKIYIFEGDDKWSKALNATFEPYQGKTTIVKKMVSDINEGDYVSLDTYFANEKVDFIKLDVEGFEMDVLRGAEKLLKANQGIKLCVCTYHKSGDADEVKEFLEKRGFTIEFSEGFMIFNEDPEYYLGSNPDFPYFRRGLIRAWR